MSFHFAIPQNTCWRNLCRTDLPSLFIKLKWSITLDYCCITHGGIHESGRKSWSGMSSTFIIYFIVITIHCHHHSPSSSLSPSPPSTVIIIFIISTFSTALAAFSQSTMRHVRLKSIAFSASRHRLMIITMRRLSLINDCNLLSLLCESSWWVVKLHRVNFEVKFWGPDNLWQV